MSVNVAFATAAPFFKSIGKGDPNSCGWRYSFDNGFVMKWRNKANTADISVLRVDEFNRVQLSGLLNLSNITPGSETSGSLLSNDQRWSIATGTLVSVVVAANVGTLTFSAAHGKAVGDKITISGATVDTDLNAAYVVASVPTTTTLTVATSNVTAATYTDALLVVTAWQTFATAGAAAVKLLAANISATGNFATLRVRARSDKAVPTWNQNTLAGDFEASGGVADYGELVGVCSYTNDNGYAQTRASHWATAGKFVTNCSGASVGSRYALVVSDYSSTLASGAGHYLARFDKPSGAQAITGVFKMGNCDQFSYLFNFEVAGGYLTDSDSGKDTDAGSLAVYTPAGAKWIKLFT